MFSRSAPRKIAEDSELYAAALRALMRRPYSTHQMKQYLERRAADKTGVTVVIMKLEQMNYLDDAKYARDYARLHANSRRQGRFRIARELRARGLADRHIAAGLDAVFAETDESALVRTRIQRKLAHLKSRSGTQIDQKKIASLYRSLMAAGFSSDIIRAEIRLATTADTSELPSGEPDEAEM
jgi:regulatory protein